MSKTTSTANLSSNDEEKDEKNNKKKKITTTTTTTNNDNNYFTSTQNVMKTSWDPFRCADWDSQKADITCLTRIKSDISAFFKDPPPGIFIEPDLNQIQRIHALIIGPSGTPYQNGFFYFLLHFPPDYPIRSPRCRLMTTSNGTVRFNPNLYKNGKICLSILGTWSGPAWSPVQSLSSLLISIQSLMSEYPYHNEPGFEQERTDGAAKTYNSIIRHETMRVAVCETLENPKSTSKQLRKIIERQFSQYYSSYLEICEELVQFDGQRMNDPFGENRGSYSYSSILQRLKTLKSKFDSIDQSTIEDDDDDDDQQQSISQNNFPKPFLDDQDFQEIFGGIHDDDDEDDDEQQINDE